MKRQHITLRLAAGSLFCAAFLIAAGSPAAQASSTTINTSALAGHFGYLDFQFDPGTTGIPLDATAAVTLTDLGGGTLAAAPPVLIGGATGDLNPNASIANTNATNGILTGFTFGSSLTFDTTFSFTPSAAADDTSDFFLILRNSTFNAIPTADPSGNDFAAQTPLDDQGGVPPPTAYQVNSAPVPEASSAVSFGLLLLFGGAAFVRTWRRDHFARLTGLSSSRCTRR